MDHIDPATKTIRSCDIWDKPPEAREAELAKCQALCVPCHRKKSRAEAAVRVRPLKHGTAYAYQMRCRCAQCRAGERERWQRYKAKYLSV